jgi:hypothetical protein
MFNVIRCLIEDMKLRRMQKIRHKMCYHYAIKYLDEGIKYGKQYVYSQYEGYWVMTEKGVVEFSLFKGYCIPSTLKIRVNQGGAIFNGRANKLEKMFLVLKERVLYLPEPPQENENESKN